MNKEIMKQFGEWLTVQRHAQELSIRETAKRIGIESSYYCKIENGLRDDLRLSTVEKINKVFPIGSFIIPLFSKLPIDKTNNK
jgi:transcriptional regulator with XRE-family HTH domain